MKKYWLVKTEPDVYGYDHLAKKEVDMWDGVRNYEARNNLKAMQHGDIVFIYHSNTDTAIVGLAEVATEHYQDPSSDTDKWVAVDLKAVRKLTKPVTLQEIKEEPRLSDMVLVKRGRLSVQPVEKDAFDLILQMAQE